MGEITTKTEGNVGSHGSHYSQGESHECIYNSSVFFAPMDSVPMTWIVQLSWDTWVVRCALNNWSFSWIRTFMARQKNNQVTCGCWKVHHFFDQKRHMSHFPMICYTWPVKWKKQTSHIFKVQIVKFPVKIVFQLGKSKVLQVVTWIDSPKWRSFQPSKGHL